MTLTNSNRHLLLSTGLMACLFFPAVGDADQEGHGCPATGGPYIILPSGAGLEREIWLFKDSEGFDDAGTGKVSDFENCQNVEGIDEEFQTIQVEHPKEGLVWIMRTGLSLTNDAGAACLAEDNTKGTLGVRGMGEGC